MKALYALLACTLLVAGCSYHETVTEKPAPATAVVVPPPPPATVVVPSD